MNAHVQITMGPEEAAERARNPKKIALAVGKTLGITDGDTIVVSININSSASLPELGLSEDEPTLSA